ncbi:hypothetical protein [Parapedobacter tibetensis]|uniref:hypothetical protein n=1 Tax=Parapedobacter tibetensis TaxID=2972951 RepID=UPI00214D6B06|nr:hypothetical protein [Parapedobacter tibetensis]
MNIELGNARTHQLYHLAEDLGEQNNPAEVMPEKLQEMKRRYEEIRGDDVREVEGLELH